MNNKLILIFLAMTLVVPTVLSADYTYTVEKDFETNISNDNGKIGTLLFQLQIENVTSTDYVSGNITITRNDQIKNTNSEILKIDGSLWEPQTTKTVISSGTKIITLVNGTQIGTIIVSDSVYPVINIVSNENDFELEFSSTQFTLDKDTIINVDYQINDKTLNGDINQEFFVNSVSIPYSISINDYYEIKIINNSCINTIIIEEQGVLCNITFENLGNTLTNINMITDKNPTYFQLDDKKLFAGNTKNYNLYYDLEGADITYNETTTFNFTTGGNSSQTIVLKLNFVDNLLPVIRQFELPEELQINKKYTITFEATDNFGIESNTAIITDPSGSIVEVSAVHDKFDIYKFDYTPATYGTHQLVLRTIDNSGNIVNTDKSFTIIKLDAYNFSNNHNYDLVTINKYESFRLGDIKESHPLNVKLTGLSYTGNIKLKLTNEDGSEYILSTGNNSEVTITKTGYYDISVLGDTVGTFDGKLVFISPDFINPLEDFSFSGEIVEFDVPEDFTDLDWNGGELKCFIVDTNDFSTSTYKCEVTIPLSDSGGGIIPITKDQYDKIQKSLQDDIQDLEDKNSFKFAWIIISCLTIFIMTIMYVFEKYILYRLVMWRW